MKWHEHTWTKMIFAHFFRFLIDLYTKQQNYREACRMSMHMMHCNQRLSRLDWIHALENAIALTLFLLFCSALVVC
jgi:hypothetical protein